MPSVLPTLLVPLALPADPRDPPDGKCPRWSTKGLPITRRWVDGGRPDTGALVPAVAGSSRLSVTRVFVVQDGLDHQHPDRELSEGDKVPCQDRVQLVDPVRRGREPLQLAPA